MNSVQTARYKAYSLSLAHLKENENITNQVPAFGMIYQSAKDTLDAIERADDRRAQKVGGIAADKQQYQEELAQQAATIAAAIGAYAQQQKNMELKEAMNFTRSELFYGSNRQLAAKCTNILNKARELAAELNGYGITEVVINSFANVLGQYEASMHRPRNTAAERKVSGTEVADLLRQLQVIFTEQLDALMLLFQNSHPLFFNEYMAKRSLVNPARRKTRVEGTVTDKATKAALQNVQVTLKESEAEALSDTDGSYSLPATPMAAATVVFAKVGYEPVEVKLPIRRGKAEVQDVELQQQ